MDAVLVGSQSRPEQAKASTAGVQLACPYRERDLHTAIAKPVQQSCAKDDRVA